MEDYVATEERTDARFTSDIAACDFYIGIIAQRYGWRPEAEGPSITELEYRQARCQTDRTCCLLFLLDEEAPWPQKWIDALGTGESAARDTKELNKLRAELAPFGPKSFTTLEDLVREVMAAIHVEDERTWKRSLESEMSRIFAECRVVPSLAPGDLGGYKMYLNVSGKENIIMLLQTTIRSLTVGVGRPRRPRERGRLVADPPAACGRSADQLQLGGAAGVLCRGDLRGDVQAVGCPARTGGPFSIV
jgi:hypothetical protein